MPHGHAQANMEGELTGPRREKQYGSDSDESHTKGEEIAIDGTVSVAERASSDVLDVNMVFVIPTKFHAPECDIVELNIGAERVVFEKPEKANEHMKPLVIKGMWTGSQSRV
jgi:hypothetical protein